MTIDIGSDYNEIQASSLIFIEGKIKPLEPTYFMHLRNLHITSHSVIYLLAVVCRYSAEKIGRQSPYFLQEIVSHSQHPYEDYTTKRKAEAVMHFLNTVD